MCHEHCQDLTSGFARHSQKSLTPNIEFGVSFDPLSLVIIKLLSSAEKPILGNNILISEGQHRHHQQHS